MTITEITTDAPPIMGTITLDEIQPGDLVFCARPGLLQELCTRAGEPWRHVGLAVPDEHGDMAISEVAGTRFDLRPLTRIVERYEAMAVGRMEADRQPLAAEAARWTAAFGGRPHVYAWDDLVLAGLVAVTRCYVLPSDEAVLERALRAAASALPRPTTGAGAGNRSFTCSSFIAAAMAEAGLDLDLRLDTSRCGPERPSLLDLARRRRRPLRAAAGSRITGGQLVGLTRALVLAALAAATGLTGRDPVEDPFRWATPGDLWRSDLLEHRWFIRPGGGGASAASAGRTSPSSGGGTQGGRLRPGNDVGGDEGLGDE